VLAELLDTPSADGLTLEPVSGPIPIAVAVKAVAGN
jgi:hypothetical protein